LPLCPSTNYYNIKHSPARQDNTESFAHSKSFEATMKNTKLVAILVLQAVLVMGILSHVNGNDALFIISVP
jgi:hypothetical protein